MLVIIVAAVVVHAAQYMHARDALAADSVGGGHAHQLSALFHENGSVRRFVSSFCVSNETVESLYYPFAAHSVEWNILGRDRAWWSVLSNSPQTKDISAEEKAKFYYSGTEHVRKVFRHLELNEESGDYGSGLSVLDFGCGLGRLAFAFANIQTVQRVACVDQSVNHLSIARNEWIKRKRRGSADVDFIATDVDLLRAVGGQRYDVVHSVIVLQHMVSQLQTAYLEQLCDVLAPGGYGWVQLPIETLGNSPSLILTLVI
mmetsp:Transcript_16268/g.39946  ORF Transcript_16268/g.39946 Transcript_16268/m.39946 type:complete len:259 (-) Transcript_16268:115-891(-)